MLLPLQGALLIAFIPRALPWARSFWAFSPYLNHMRNFSKIRVMDFALNIVLMGFAEGMTIVYGVLAVIASIMLLWLKSKWGQKWLDSLD